MILAEASPALEISITLLIIVHVVVSLFMILVVMMQRPKQEGLGAAFGGGMTDQLLGAGTTSFLQRATVILGILFFLISLILAILIGRSNRQEGIDGGTDPVPTESAAAPLVPGEAPAPEVDTEEEELLKALEGQSDPAAESPEDAETAPAEEAVEMEVTTESVEIEADPAVEMDEELAPEDSASAEEPEVEE